MKKGPRLKRSKRRIKITTSSMDQSKFEEGIMEEEGVEEEDGVVVSRNEI